MGSDEDPEDRKCFDRKCFDVVMVLIDTCANLPMDDRLLVLQLAWIILAQQARNQALAFPGGFQGEQSRQVGQLEKTALLVREDTPDIELERLTQEGDYAGCLEHLRKLRDDLEKGET
jgi:hypothetical protein